MTPCAICSTDQHPTEACQGLACDACANRILALLRRIEACYAALDPVPGRVGDPGGRGSPGYRSSSPANDTVLVETDRRSRNDARGTDVSVLAAVCAWTRQIAYERDARQPVGVSMAGECAFLRGQHSWIVSRPWVADYAAELEQLLRTLRRLTGLAPEPPVGRCIVVGCGGNVFVTPDREGVRCARCYRLYTGYDLARLRVAQGA